MSIDSKVQRLHVLSCLFYPHKGHNVTEGYLSADSSLHSFLGLNQLIRVCFLSCQMRHVVSFPFLECTYLKLPKSNKIFYF